MAKKLYAIQENGQITLPKALRAEFVGLHKIMTRRSSFASFTAKHVNVIK